MVRLGAARLQSSAPWPPLPWSSLPLEPLPELSPEPPPWSSTVGTAVGIAVGVAVGVGVARLRRLGLWFGLGVAVGVARGVSCSPAVSGSDGRPVACVDSDDAAAVTPATSRTPAIAARIQRAVLRTPSP